MKRLVLIIAILTSLTVMSQDFRKATWGVSPSEVKLSESDKLVEESSEYLVYETTLVGFKTFVEYIFAGDKLVRAKYIINETHFNNNDYVSDYDLLNSFLKKKYGEPVEEEVYWKGDPPYSNDKSGWGFDISIGRLVLYSIYRNEITEIEIILSAEDFNPVIAIQYSSLSEELKKIEEEKILEDF